MVAAIKQLVTVNADSSITIRDTSLTPGSTAEVIVLVDEAPRAAPVKHPSKLDAFRALQAAFNLDREAAEQWAAETRTLRDWNRPPQ